MRETKVQQDNNTDIYPLPTYFDLISCRYHNHNPSHHTRTIALFFYIQPTSNLSIARQEKKYAQRDATTGHHAPDMPGAWCTPRVHYSVSLFHGE
jgi:hypothetical protein